MTVNTTTNRVSYAGNGTTKSFAVPFPFLADADLVVLERTDSTGAEVTKTLTTHYTVSGAGGVSGTVAMLNAPATGVTLVIYRDPTLTQLVDLVSNDPLPVETAVEQPLDRLTMMAQRNRDLVERALRLPDSDTGFVAADMKIPAKVTRASKYLAFDADGKPIASAVTPGTVAVSAFMQTVVDDINAAAARDTLGITSIITAVTGRRNRIINGNFDIWQRGLTFAAATGGRYTADQWTANATGSTIAASRQAFTIGQTAVPGEPLYFYRAVAASVAGAANHVILAHLIEDVRTLAGQQITFSFYAKADATKNIVVEFAQYFGAGGAPSADVLINPTTCGLTTAWQRFTITTTVPSVAGKTVGTTETGSFQINIWMDAGSNYNSRVNNLGQQSGTFDFARIQLERGDVATTFEERSVGEELALCQRYYHKTYDMDVAPGTVTNAGAIQFTASGTGHVQPLRYPVQMYRAPTVTFYNPVSGAAGTWRDISGAADRTVGIGLGSGTTGDSAVLTASVDLSTNRGHYVADASLL